MMRSVVAASLISYASGEADWVADTAHLLLEDDPIPLIKDTLVEAFKEIGKVFTHDRTIMIALHTPTGLMEFEHWDHHDYADDGVDFAWEHIYDGMSGLGITFHNDGPISGCVAFRQPQCGWALYVAASNPLAGHNKARIGYLKVESGSRGCYEIWDDMDGWGQTEGSVHKDNHWDTYDNPSSISYTLGIPDECRHPPGEYKHKGWIHETDFSGGGDLGQAPYTSSGDAFNQCKAMDGCNAFTHGPNDPYGETVWFKNVFQSSKPTHNPHLSSFVMAQKDYKGTVHTHTMWKIIDGVRLHGHIATTPNTGDRPAITQQCENMSGCAAFTCDSNTCYFTDFNHGFTFVSDLGFTSYVEEGNPWSNSALAAANVSVI